MGFDLLGKQFPLPPPWQQEFEVTTYQQAASRLAWLAILALMINLPLFALVDLRAWTAGHWAGQPAHERIFWWRIAVVALFTIYYIAWRFGGLGDAGRKAAAWGMVVGMLVLGTLFTLSIQTLIHDVSIYALVLFLLAGVFPMPGWGKPVLYGTALMGLLAGLRWATPDTNMFLEIIVNAVCCTIVVVIVDRLVLNSHRMNFVHGKIIEEDRGKSDRLLRNVLPDDVVRRLRESPGDTIVQFHGEVSVLFADVAGFTQMSMKLPASDLIRFLDRLFLAFDEAAERLGIEKIKTIGDAYMAACGVPLSVDDHAERIAELALEMQRIIIRFDTDGDLPLALRIGIHTGPVIAGVIGRKKFCYDLWGDTVNTASRLESHGAPGRIHVSEQVYHHLKGRFAFESRGEVAVRSKGTMQTYFLLGAR
jgi:class 3 adenylate cyclase